MVQNAEPHCFGKEWDPKDVDCTGGLNPAYRNPTDGSRQQPACTHHDACRVRLVLQRVQEGERSGVLIRPESLVRGRMSSPTQNPQPYQAPVQPYRPPQAAPVQQHAHVPSVQVPPGYPQYPPQVYQQPYPQQGYAPPGYPPPYPYPVPTQPMQYARENLGVSPHVHPYLAVPEPRKPGEIMVPLKREMLRASFKAMGQTFANFFDFVTLGDE